MSADDALKRGEEVAKFSTSLNAHLTGRCDLCARNAAAQRAAGLHGEALLSEQRAAAYDHAWEIVSLLYRSHTPWVEPGHGFAPDPLLARDELIRQLREQLAAARAYRGAQLRADRDTERDLRSELVTMTEAHQRMVEKLRAEKIRAVNAVRRLTGLGLAEAKRELETTTDDPFPTRATGTLHVSVRQDAACDQPLSVRQPSARRRGQPAPYSDDAARHPDSGRDGRSFDNAEWLLQRCSRHAAVGHNVFGCDCNDCTLTRAFMRRSVL